MYFFPSEVEACNSQCVTDLAPQFSQDCIDCIAGAECMDLESGRACQDECSFDAINRLNGDEQ